MINLGLVVVVISSTDVLHRKLCSVVGRIRKALLNIICHYISHQNTGLTTYVFDNPTKIIQVWLGCSFYSPGTAPSDNHLCCPLQTLLNGKKIIVGIYMSQSVMYDLLKCKYFLFREILHSIIEVKIFN